MRLDQFNNSAYQRGAPFLKEVLWYLVKMAFFTTRFPWADVWQCQLLRLFGAKVGKKVVIHPCVNITMPWNLELGDFVWIGEGVTILSLAPVQIQSHVCLSQEVYICTGNHDYRKQSFDLIVKPILIEEGVWVAARAFVGPGVSIGKNAVVTAGSIVKQSLPANMVCTGNPCDPIKRRYDK
ncbi:MAG: WcaF family extracellular polysaccharide biosynthesis acetyltransferase [Verrucomicrobiae bacterium]|nr:WcaF family extracellular polysaccharide biosynthesis acetyltransferase [Verrucomicrobiae bacterium]